MRPQSFILLCAAGCLPLAALHGLHGEEAAGAHETRPASQSLEILNFSDLLSKAERILTAEIGPENNGFVLLKDVQYIKHPKQKDIHPDVLKRAAELLADDGKGEKKDLPPLKNVAVVPLRLALNPGQKLPPQGTQALFFLWERMGDGPGGEITYRAAHPQNIYDPELAPQVRLAVDRPRSVADGRFLRAWDKAMFQRAAQRRADLALLQAPGGNNDKGLSVRAARPALALRKDNSFSVAAVLENSLERELLVYDGPAGGFGVRLRRKGAPKDSGLILRLSARNSVGSLDDAVLDITDVTDFSTLKGNGGLSKELYFDAAQFPVLKTLSGEYALSVFYGSHRDGGQWLEKAAWTGAVVSPEVPLAFEQHAAK